MKKYVVMFRFRWVIPHEESGDDTLFSLLFEGTEEDVEWFVVQQEREWKTKFSLYIQAIKSQVPKHSMYLLSPEERHYDEAYVCYMDLKEEINLDLFFEKKLIDRINELK